MKNKIGKILKIIISAAMIFMLIPEMAFAETTPGNDAYVYRYDGVAQWGLRNDNYHKNNLTALFNIDSRLAYCVDKTTNIVDGHMYARTTLAEAGYYGEAAANMIRAILTNSYPTVNIGTLQSNSGISGLSEQEAITGTQFAIWGYSNTGVTYGGSNENVKRLIAYLNGLAPAGIYQTNPVLLNINASQNGDQIIFDYSTSENIASLKNAQFDVKANGRAVTFQNIDNKIIIDTTSVTSNTNYTITISGTQDLAPDVYFYKPQGGTKASQSLVGFFSGSSKVSTSSSFDYDPSKVVVNVNLTAKKTYTDTVTNTNKSISPSDFEFSLKDKAGNLISTATADATGSVTFVALTYNKTQANSVFEYQVTENKGTNPGITYDETIYKVVVSPKIVDGKFKADVKYFKGTTAIDGIPSFENKYTAKPTNAKIEGLKTLENKTLENEMFTFQLLDKDNKVLQTVKNSADGKITFAELGEFDRTGTHIYYVQEVKPETPRPGITYDTTKYEVKVEIKDDNKGKLYADVTYPNNNEVWKVTNTYKAKPVDVEIKGTKELTGRNMVDREFSFNLKSGEQLIQTSNNLTVAGYFSFKLNYDKPGSHKYTVTEVGGSLGGVTYSKQSFDVIVDITDNGLGQLVAKVTYPENGIKFINEYKPTPISVQLEANKNLDKMKLTNEMFSFELIQTFSDGTADKVIATAKNNQDGKVTFNDIIYTKGGVYNYKIREVNDGASGIIYDSNVFEVQVTINDDGHGTLTKNINYKNGAAIFNNQYKPESTTYNLTAKKMLDGRDLKAGEFTFDLYQGTNKLDSATNTADGLVTFKELTFDKAGVYNYMIKERIIAKGGIVYDEKEVAVIITVNDVNGKLVAEVNINNSDIIFKNQYMPENATVTLTAKKTLSGKTLEANMFEFVLLDGTTVIDRVKNDGQGNITFKTLSFDEVMTKTYAVREIQEDKNGITTDKNEYQITIKVTDNKDGKLIATVSDNAKDMIFKNKYEAKPVEFNLTLEKELIGKNLETGMFEFALMGDNDVSEVVKNTGKDIIFSPITIKKAGTHTYRVEETNDGKNGYIYDSQAIVVEVIVIDDGLGNLKIETINYVGNKKKFTNQYNVTDTFVNISGTKNLSGRTIKDGEFKFLLYENGAEVAHTFNVGNSFVFANIEYTEAGTHEYTVYEANTGYPGVTYDNSNFKVTVEVIDVDSKLKATVKYPDDGLVFENTYKANETELLLSVNKQLEVANSELKLTADMFSFELHEINSDSSKRHIQTVNNDATGTVAFDAIKYDEVGTHKYTITEVNQQKAGFTYDDPITVTVVVVDDGQGQLKATPVYDNDKKTFVNSYKPNETEIVISAIKKLEGRKLNANEFTFILEDANKNTISAKNDADGNVIFDAIKYDRAGTYKYSIYEVSETLDGVTYDNNTYEVTVNVKEEDGYLYATADHVTEQLVFTNEYIAEKTNATIAFKKDLVGRDTKNDEFEFKLIGTNHEFALETTNGNSDSISFSPIEYTESGIYEYKIIEVNNGIAGITYDPTEFYVTVTVTDDMNGKLKAVVDYNGIDPVFNNTYTPKEVEITLKANKTLRNLEIADYQFEFNLFESNQLLETVKNDKLGNVVFASIKLDAVGTYTYTIKEVVGEIPGITYDTREFNIVVDVTDDLNGSLVADVQYPEDLDDNIIEFVNTYDPDSVTTFIEVSKSLTGRVLTANEFSFVLSSNDVNLTTTNTKDGIVKFGPLIFDEVGNYEYQITETNTNLGGIGYDPQIIKVIVHVTDNKTGQLQVAVEYPEDKIFKNTYIPQPVIVDLEANKTLTGSGLNLAANMFSFELKDEKGDVKQTKTNDVNGLVKFDSLSFTNVGTYLYTISEVIGDSAGVTYDTNIIDVKIEVTDDLMGNLVANVSYPVLSANFENKYLAKSTYVTINGHKTLEGRDLEANDFGFSLYTEDDTFVETVRNNQNGFFSFNPITYDQVGTYEYYVIEETNSNDGIAYDLDKELITVTVTDDGSGQLKANVNYHNGEALSFENYYSSKPVYVDLDITKELVGLELADEEFEFVLYNEDGGELQTRTNASNGTINFEPLEFEEPGKYIYTVKETNTNLEGYIYDSQTIDIVIDVTDNLKGELIAEISYPTKQPKFTNTYKPSATSAAIVANKRLLGKDLTIGQFDFAIYDNDGEILRQAKNGVDGVIEFEAIIYEEAGTYNYTVKEIDGVQGGVTYDKTAFEVTVEVVDNKEGKLEATIHYPENGITFINEYTTKSIKAAVDPDKKLIGRPLVAGEFSFELVNDQGEVVETIKNGPDESFIFTPLEYSEPGIYNYTVREVQGNIPGITYDKNVYPATVTVEDNAQGQLVATISYPEGDPTFVNTYNAKSIGVDLSINKVLSGRVLTDGMFSFNLVDNQGKLIETRSNNAHGKVTFSSLTFTQTGTYNYRIYENNNKLYGVAYDSGTVDVVITVTDNNQGQLVATVTYPSKQPTFNNYYSPRVPRTGDATNINILFMMLIAALGGIGFISYRRKLK